MLFACFDTDLVQFRISLICFVLIWNNLESILIYFGIKLVELKIILIFLMRILKFILFHSIAFNFIHFGIMFIAFNTNFDINLK